MRVLLRAAGALSGLAALCAGCSSNHVGVDAKSDALATYQASEGTVNTPGFQLGDVVAVDSQTGKTWKIASLQVNPTDIAMAQSDGSSSEPFTAGFKFDFSQKVSNTMKSNVDEAVGGQTMLNVQNCFTRKLKDPAIFAAGSPELAQAIEKAKAQDPDSKFFLVSGVTSADKVFLTFEGDGTFKSGNYQFHISYPQNGGLDQLAKDRPAFFEATPLKFEQQEGLAAVSVDQ